ASLASCFTAYQAFLADGTTCKPKDDCALCVYARRSLGFLSDVTLNLTIELDADQCLGVLCPADQTCVGGTCKSAQTSCDPDQGVCDLGGGATGGADVSGAGGAGAGNPGGGNGVGGTGGAGGEGCSPTVGGGGSDALWEPLLLPCDDPAPA